MTQNIEYIDCAESAIKALEKMTYENAFAMLEHDAFSAILSLIDFFDLNLRKCALKACLNMTKSLNNMDYIKKFFYPAIPSLTNLTRYNGNTEIEKTILDLAVQCFYNLAYYVKFYNLSTNQYNFCNALIQYGLLDILFDLFIKFLGENEFKENIKFSANILIDTFKNILKLFEILCSLSSDISNLLLNMNILETIYNILHKELEGNDRKKAMSNSNSFYQELFALLISFFPAKNSKHQDRLLSPMNKSYFNYFSDKILSLLINNVVNIPSSHTMVSLVKLIEMYIENSPLEYVKIYLDPTKLSNIIGKMVDSKDSSYVIEVFNIVEIIMSKVPEYFFVSFIREGVADNIKNLMEVEESQLYISQDYASKYSDNLLLKEKYIQSLTSEKMEELFVEDDNDEYSNDADLIKEDSDTIESKQKPTLQQLQSQTQSHESFNDLFSIKSKGGDANSSLVDKSSIREYIKNKVYQKQFNTLTSVNNKFVKDKDAPVVVDKQELSNILDKQEQSNIISSNKVSSKKPSGNYQVVKTIQTRAKEITEKYFSDEDIKKLLLKANSSINPQTIIVKLNEMKEILKNPTKVDINFLKNLFNFILEENKLTFYEVEKSEIIIFLAKYIDENFVNNLNNTNESENKLSYNISGNYNKNIISTLKLLFASLDYDSEKIKELIKLLQHCISSMNCFKLFLYDIGSLKNASHLFFSFFKSQVPKIRLKFHYSPSDESIKKLLEDKNPTFKEIYEYFLNKKFISLSFDPSDTFEVVSEALVNYRNKIKESIVQHENQNDDYYEEIITQLRERKGSEEDIGLTEKLLQKLIDRKKSIESAHEVEIAESNVDENILDLLEINFFVNANNSRIEIGKDKSIKEFFRNIKNSFSRSEYLSYSNDIQINFDINFKKSKEAKFPNDISKDNQIGITNFLFYEDLMFEKYYRENIINNKSLYCIIRACPFIYLISLMELCVNNFSHIFRIKSIPNNHLENLKMTSLLFKQVKDPYAVSSSNIPNWCKDICQSFPYLSGFNSRYLLYKVSSFDSKRAMTNLYVYLKNYMGETILDDKTLSQSKRSKVKVDRENILKDTEKLMKELHSFNGYLEFEYLNETGTGIGPTYEFYSLFASEIKKITKLWYKTTDFSLFPAQSQNKIQLEENKKLFNQIGFIIARGLYDDRLLDFPLNSLFWDLVLSRPISVQKIKSIDKDLGNAISDFLNIIEEKKNVLNKYSNLSRGIDLNSYITYNNMKIEDIGLNFTLPGYEIELKEGGETEQVNIYNIEEYVALVCENTIKKDVTELVESFKNGFNLVFPVESLKCFTSKELEQVICGCSSESWDITVLLENIIPTHGFDKNSQIFNGLLDILCNLNNFEKKKFLLFVTGSPRLPLGGFKSLNPKLTVVKKQPEQQGENPDLYLPTVMTCQNYLKIPDYSTLTILKEKLIQAMNEGGNAFHLS